MDQELLAFLNERFGRLDDRLDARFGEVNARFGEVNARFGEVNARFGEVNARFDEVNARFGEVNARFDQLEERFNELDKRTSEQFKETLERFEKVDETARQTLVLIEDIRSQIRLVAEGYRICDDRLARIEKDREYYTRSIHMEDPVKDLDNRVSILEGWVARHQEVVGEAIHKLASPNPGQQPLPSK